jgi:hypothetical protein
MSRQLPPRPSLEHLRKQAKELLAAMQPHDPTCTLSDAQHALAREYGFDSWPKLKAHVDDAAKTINPFTGTWNADVASSMRHPANLFERATLHFQVEGNTITITHDGVGESGRAEHGTHTVQADGIERTFDHGYALRAQWLGPRVFQVVATQHGRAAGGGTYEVSPDGRTMTVSTEEQRIVFVRG